MAGPGPNGEPPEDYKQWLANGGARPMVDVDGNPILLAANDSKWKAGGLAVSDGPSIGLGGAWSGEYGNLLQAMKPDASPVAEVHDDGLLKSVNARINEALESHSLPDVRDLTDSQRADLYTRMFYERATPEAAAAFDLGESVILGLRVETDPWENRGRGLFDDRAVVLRRGDYGNVSIDFEGPFNTEPAGAYEDKGPFVGAKSDGRDANGDGRLDLGRIPGDTTREYRWGYSADVARFGPKVNDGNILEPVAKVGAERDVNHDGLFDAVDDSLVTDRNALSADKSMLIHRGYEGGPAGPFTGSSGCQTVAPRYWKDFLWSLPTQSQQSRIFYTLMKM